MPSSQTDSPEPGSFKEAPGVGDRAPDFILPTASGKKIRLKDQLGKKIVVLYFYPHDFSGDCTKEARAFRDHYLAFKNLGAEVFGISRDSVESHRKFVRSESLPFNLLSDPEGKAHRLYGVEKVFGILPRRTTYVVEPTGKILFKYSSLLRPHAHPKKSIQALRNVATKATTRKATRSLKRGRKK